jgi:hypothetical protein
MRVHNHDMGDRAFHVHTDAPPPPAKISDVNGDIKKHIIHKSNDAYVGHIRQNLTCQLREDWHADWLTPFRTQTW